MIQRTCVSSDNWSVRVTAEDIIISKLEWAKLSESQRQIADVATVLRTRKTALDCAYLEKWIANLGLQKDWRSARNAIGI